MQQLWSLLIGAALAGGTLHGNAADPPPAQQEQSKEQATKDNPQGKPSGTQRKTTLPET
jgi:hypothetical protein